jgi:hypothetical protein
LNTSGQMFSGQLTDAPLSQNSSPITPSQRSNEAKGTE